MRKLTKRYKRWLLHRAQAHKKNKAGRLERLRERHYVWGWDGGERERLLAERRADTPPSEICFISNPDESIKFLAGIRSKSRAVETEDAWGRPVFVAKPRSPNGMKRVRKYWDFSKVKKISTAAALVLTAEYDRLAQIAHQTPPTIDLERWSHPFFKRMYEIGFFEVVGLTEDVASLYRTDGDVQTMRIISGMNANQLQQASECIRDLIRFIDTAASLRPDAELALNNALSEAMANVSAHAYPVGHEFKYRHVGKWWVTASADRLTRELSIVIYDQGASIPVTYARKELSQEVKDVLASIFRPEPTFEFANDGAYIQTAMLPGKSQTNQRNRGYGLPEMKTLVDICEWGSLRILSRGGEAKYEYGKNSLDSTSRDVSVGGTLIEWTLRIPQGLNSERHEDNLHS